MTRFRADNGFGLRVVCWHGRQADLIAPDKATAESWEFFASCVPCKWIKCTVEEQRNRERARNVQQPGRSGRTSRPAHGTAVVDFWANLDRDGDGQ